MKLRGKILRRLPACAFAGAACLWMVLDTTAALAQPPQYKNDAELMGAAIASPEGVGEVLARLVQKCGLYGASTRDHGNSALRAWQARHRDYLAEGRRVRAELQATYTDSQARERFDELLRTQLPMLVERQFVVYSRSIDDQPTESAKADLCDGYFSAVDDLQFDLKVNDPALAAFFDRRISAHGAARGAARGADDGGSGTANAVSAAGDAAGPPAATSAPVAR
ncbi:hypothetical protein [Pandoraea pnomenusa]|uniref:Uncharacterized protein n=1 Tax=Pandoraea pnomenusa TaxID=93220 RepID=A0ABY6WL65_9BURK|nr:hypothetical protein [Pandoraea pnomenusa]AHB08577.1 hypothetical protein U875_17050 [Pandoraea pnomenusa 3kgm]AHN77403.3 hypothetical protein DA70_09190 [Pandoraea pnomenusa]ANC45816.1 hypothetical protein A6P55_18185 [Pandoraea pnomenusa]QDH58973.1 hypothetical protein FKQ53_06575 [Pandoraea pnomenusa]VVE67991.1 hypothetical protein PPN31119_02807 [Pandoraea pnomenusa]